MRTPFGRIVHGRRPAVRRRLRADHCGCRSAETSRDQGWGSLCGGLLVTLLTGLWLTSSLWFFTNVGFPFSR
jgi:hypothetical protein